MTRFKIPKSGIVALLLFGIFFIGQFIAQQGVNAPYSAADQAISELGITQCGSFIQPQTNLTYYVCSPLWWIMDATFVLYGAFIMWAVVNALRSVWPGGRLRKLGLIVVFFGGIEAVVSGFSPLNLTPFLHTLSGGLAIGALNLGLLLLGFAAIKQRRQLGIWTLVWATVGIVGFMMSGTPPYSGIGYGGWERVAGSAFAIWGIGLGAVWYYRSVVRRDSAAAKVR